MLLSATLDGAGVLTFIGSPGNDDIQFAAGGLPGQVILTGDPDGESGTFGNVTAIVVRAGALIDTIRTWFSRE